MVYFDRHVFPSITFKAANLLLPALLVLLYLAVDEVLLVLDTGSLVFRDHLLVKMPREDYLPVVTQLKVWPG